MKKIFLEEKGQSLIEAMAALALTAVVVVVLGNFAVRATRDADYAKNQLQASLYAQEGIEAVRAIRDQDSAITVLGATKWSDLWDKTINATVSAQLSTNDLNSLSLSSSNSAEKIDNFQRTVSIIDKGNDPLVKQVTVKVTWGSDPDQKSQVTEYFSKW
ncbi:MAG: hypothetical protein M1150_00895 [Patescibacteria group bacterium]|nr:hypothetical protein [Patescibacteria group bacterium]